MNNRTYNPKNVPTLEVSDEYLREVLADAMDANCGHGTPSSQYVREGKFNHVSWDGNMLVTAAIKAMRRVAVAKRFACDTWRSSTINGRCHNCGHVSENHI